MKHPMRPPMRQLYSATSTLCSTQCCIPEPGETAARPVADFTRRHLRFRLKPTRERHPGGFTCPWDPTTADMLDITNLRTQRTVVELQTHCVLSSGSRNHSRPSVVPESIAILLCWDGVAITALWGRYNPGGRTMLLIYLRLSNPRRMPC